MIDNISINVSGTQIILSFRLFSQYNVKHGLGGGQRYCDIIGTGSAWSNLAGKPYQ